jgi:hypothetical protein
MRTLLVPSLILGLLLVAAGGATAADKTQAIIDKAIKAHGGAEKLTKNKHRATQSKSKGTIELAGGITYTQETFLQAGKFKDIKQLSVMGQDVAVTIVYDGKKAWANANGKTMELEGKILDEIKESMYMIRLAGMVFLKEKGVELSPLGEVKVNDRSAVGVKVASKGHRDLNLYFDKESGLLAKTEHQALDELTQKEVAEERIVQEYQEVDGIKVAKKALINREGKKFMEIEVLEVKFPDKLDDSEFAKP